MANSNSVIILRKMHVKCPGIFPLFDSEIKLAHTSCLQKERFPMSDAFSDCHRMQKKIKNTLPSSAGWVVYLTTPLELRLLN